MGKSGRSRAQGVGGGEFRNPCRGGGGSGGSFGGDPGASEARSKGVFRGPSFAGLFGVEVPQTLDTKPKTLNRKPQTLNPTPSTLNPKP